MNLIDGQEWAIAKDNAKQEFGRWRQVTRYLGEMERMHEEFPVEHAELSRFLEAVQQGKGYLVKEIHNTIRKDWARRKLLG